MTTAINIGAFGYILGMLGFADETPLWKQIDKGYAHGGGWKDFEGFEVLAGNKQAPFTIQYPDDPPYSEIGRIHHGDEILAIFPYGWVLWCNLETNETRIARID